MQARLNEEQSMKLIVHLFEAGYLTDENSIVPTVVNTALSTHYNVKLVSVVEKRKTFEAIQGLPIDVSRVILAIAKINPGNGNDE